MRLTDDAKAVVVLTTRLGDPSRPSLASGGWHTLARRLADEDLSPADLFSRIPAGLSHDEEARLDALLADAPAVLVALEELAGRGIWVRTVADEGYPERLRSRLGTQAPPVLFGVGDPDLLHVGGVGVVGSRDVSPEGAEVARAVAAEAARLGRAVVSGAARGVDRLAMDAAWEAGGRVVGVVADALTARIRQADVLAAVDDGSVCLVTARLPSAGFSPAAAMSRNKVIYALADLTVVVASAEGGGGTWNGAVEALRRGFGPVAVWRGRGEGPGNEALVPRGAVPLRDVADLEAMMGSDPGESPEQMSLL